MKQLLLALPLLLSTTHTFAASRCGSVQLHRTFAPPYVIKDHFSLNNDTHDGVFLTGASDAINERLLAEGEVNAELNDRGQPSKIICVEGSLKGQKPVDTMTVTIVREADAE